MTNTARFATVSLLLLGPLAAESSTAPELGAIYDKAMREVKAGFYDAALQNLDTIDTLAARPEDKAEALNLRGLIMTRELEYEGAEVVLHRAIEIDPKSWNASFNLAEISFLKKDWAEAGRRFAAMVANPANGPEAEVRQFIGYKILLTYLLGGESAAATRLLDQQPKGSPTSYYFRAALARQNGRKAEAADWLASAEQHFSAEVNRLYAESFYEIGWEKKPPGEGRENFEIVPAEQRDARAASAAWADFEKAQRAFRERRTTDALRLLDRFDETVADQAVSYNLRGEILIEEGKLDEAEEMVCQALSANPNLRQAVFNLAQIAFKEKDYAQARDQLELIFSETPGGENQVAQLIKFEIFLTFLLEGNEAEAGQLMDQFKFTGETPALYYAQAAWAFQHANPERANGWIDSAQRIYSAALNLAFADSFYDLGWLKSRPENRALAPANLAEISPGLSAEITPAGPASSPSWTPGMLLSMNRGLWPARTTTFSSSWQEIVPSITWLPLPNDPGKTGAPFPNLLPP